MSDLVEFAIILIVTLFGTTTLIVFFGSQTFEAIDERIARRIRGDKHE